MTFVLKENSKCQLILFAKMHSHIFYILENNNLFQILRVSRSLLREGLTDKF